MKKILAAALAVIMAALTLTGCDKNESTPNTPNSGSNTSSDSNTSNTSGDNTSGDNAGTGIADFLENAVKAYHENIQTNPDLTFYPMQQASADGAVWGKTDDGYLYVIVHENGEDIANVMLGKADRYDPEMEGMDNSEIAYPENGAGELAKKALGTDGWPAMEAFSDQETVGIAFSEDFKLDLCDEYFFATNMMSAQLNKVVIIKPKAGDMA